MSHSFRQSARTAFACNCRQRQERQIQRLTNYLLPDGSLLNNHGQPTTRRQQSTSLYQFTFRPVQ